MELCLGSLEVEVQTILRPALSKGLGYAHVPQLSLRNLLPKIETPHTAVLPPVSSSATAFTPHHSIPSPN
ncbi:hypothetical protein E2C01_008629 [Portunus trituberculatus]|uniref:Uncharacterized protein n=1 Tax=Portunus trituberculatus TaxID=210409 RepID=A0A5B7D4Y1_PORTR|nr:hypothetical protein [Portunus trituberculatus]